MKIGRPSQEYLGEKKKSKFNCQGELGINRSIIDYFQTKQYDLGMTTRIVAMDLQTMYLRRVRKRKQLGTSWTFNKSNWWIERFGGWGTENFEAGIIRNINRLLLQLLLISIDTKTLLRDLRPSLDQINEEVD